VQTAKTGVKALLDEGALPGDCRSIAVEIAVFPARGLIVAEVGGEFGVRVV
jgi:hypothetical protein